MARIDEVIEDFHTQIGERPTIIIVSEDFKTIFNIGIGRINSLYDLDMDEKITKYKGLDVIYTPRSMVMEVY